jgi:hypothetical protein
MLEELDVTLSNTVVTRKEVLVILRASSLSIGWTTISVPRSQQEERYWLLVLIYRR